MVVTKLRPDFQLGLEHYRSPSKVLEESVVLLRQPYLTSMLGGSIYNEPSMLKDLPG
jgi:hypothetical protein